jgi:hypothetical protein
VDDIAVVFVVIADLVDVSVAAVEVSDDDVVIATCAITGINGDVVVEIDGMDVVDIAVGAVVVAGTDVFASAVVTLRVVGVDAVVPAVTVVVAGMDVVVVAAAVVAG